MGDPENTDVDTDQGGDPLAGENMSTDLTEDESNAGAVAKTDTQLIDANGQPLAPPPGH